MKGDFTRSTYQPQKHYSGVRMQQGRVQLDADWNEAVDIAAHRVETEALDVLGVAGGPLATAGFQLVSQVGDLPASQQAAAAALPVLEPGDFIISAGRYYVDGVLCENESPVIYSQQPDPPGEALPQAGTYLAYLHVWSRHVSVLEDPEIREVALGGPDTATRTQTVWQVKLLAVDAADAVDTGDVQESLLPRSTGRLSARSVPGAPQSDPCLIEPGAGYRGTENQLYRVEIHAPGELGTATFKWSRDNGSIAFAWLGQSGNQLTVANVGKDRALGLKEGDILELTDDTHELTAARLGQLVTLVNLDGQTLTVEPLDSSETIDFLQYPSRPIVRRWNGVGAVSTTADNEGYVELEAGVQVKFDAGHYSRGDYWQVPARTATGVVEISAQPPLGIVHHYCRLAVLELDGQHYTKIQDCRRRFPAITELTSLFYLSGDAQEARPGQAVAQPLRVGVANGQWPVAGAAVRFAVKAGSGTVQSSQPAVTVLTDAAGVAACSWTLDAKTPHQYVEATLLDAAGNVRHLPVRFNAALNTDVRNPVIRAQLRDGGLLANDSAVIVARFLRGIDLICDADLDALNISRATCPVTLEIPFPSAEGEKALWGSDLLGYQTLVLAATVSAKDQTIHWTPAVPIVTFLNQRLFPYLKQNGLDEKVSARLTVHFPGSDFQLGFWLVASTATAP